MRDFLSLILVRNMTSHISQHHLSVFIFITLLFCDEVSNNLKTQSPNWKIMALSKICKKGIFNDVNSDCCRLWFCLCLRIKEAFKCFYHDFECPREADMNVYHNKRPVEIRNGRVTNHVISSGVTKLFYTDLLYHLLYIQI